MHACSPPVAALRPNGAELSRLSAEIQRKRAETRTGGDVINPWPIDFYSSNFPEVELLRVLVRRGDERKAQTWLALPRLDGELRVAIEQMLAEEHRTQKC